jgi:signal transduction histidine kinase
VAPTICILIMLLSSAVSAETPIRKSLLIINEVGPAHPASAVVTEQVILQLAADPRYQTEFYVESLDSPLFSDVFSQQSVETGLVDKYQGRNIHAVIAMGPAPIRFLMSHPDFLAGVPVVICGSTRVQAGDPTLSSRFTGSWMDFDLAKTLEVARALVPETKEVVVVSGSSQFDQATLRLAKSSLGAHPVPLQFTYFDGLDMSTLLERLRQLPKGTVVLYLSFFRDSLGSQFVNATTALPLVAEAASVPVFGVSDTYLGHGMVGGYVVSFAAQGRIAANLATEIFAGKQASEIPVVAAPSVYMFDSKQLSRWGLSDNKLPAGSVVINREPSVWARAKWVILPGLGIILTLSLSAMYLSYDRKQLTAARQEHIRLSGMLINAQEEERRRLAAELHDDFSQRLALLSLGLETAAEEVNGSPTAVRQMNDLINSASELGADLHTLSHRLHSSTLERLGLAPGIASFCNEIAAQNGTKVTFSHAGVPQSVTPDVALCLFRIVQEALRNVRKHSGARNARVRLEAERGELHLSISDDGRGFDTLDLSRRQGLGLWSMEERVHLIGGRFKLFSENHQGTRVEVWAPMNAKTKTAHEDVDSKPDRGSAVSSG